MSLALFFSGDYSPVDDDNPIIIVPRHGLNFHIGEEPEALGARVRRRNKRRTLGPLGLSPVLRNEYIQQISGLSIEYSLHNRALFRCAVVDPVDPLIAYRPNTADATTVELEDGTVIFAGEVATTVESSIMEANTGTKVQVQCVDIHALAEKMSFVATYGGDPNPLLGIVSGNPAVLFSIEPHGFAHGDLVRIADTGGDTPEMDGVYVVTIGTPYNFSIPFNLSTDASGGTATKVTYLKTILTAIIAPLAPYGISIDPTMPDGPVIDKIVFDGSIIDALNQLSARTGYVYRWLPTGLFQMFEPGSRPVDFVIDGDFSLEGLTITKSRLSYGNVVKLNYGSNAIVNKFDVFRTNGTDTSWPLTYKLALPDDLAIGAGTLVNNTASVVVPVYIEGQTTPVSTWYYRASDNTLRSTVSVPAGTLFQYIYPVQFPQSVTVKDAPAIALNNGREVVKEVSDTSIFDIGAALQSAETELASSIVEPRKVNIVTKQQLSFPGSTVELYLPDRGLGGDSWLITNVTMVEDIDLSIRYTYQLLEDNARKPGWVELFRKLGGVSSSTTVSSKGSSIPSAGGVTSTGAGTPNYLSKWLTPTTLGDSNTQVGVDGLIVDGDLTMSGTLTVTELAQAGAFQSNLFRGVTVSGADFVIQNAASQNVLVVLTGSTEVIAVTALRTPDIRSDSTLMISPGGNVTLNPAGKNVNPNMGYDIHLGSLQKKYSTIYVAELWTETLVAQNTLATIGGRVLVGPTTILVRDFLAADIGFASKYNNLAVNDIVYLESNGKVEFMRITSGPVAVPGEYQYGVTRNLDGTGANDWFAGDAIFNTGQVGNGFIDLYSVRGIRAGTEVGPTIVGNIRNSTTFNDWSPRWAIGNLNGLYGYTTNVFGVALGDPAAAWIKIDPTGGVRIGHGGNTFAQISASGSAAFTGTVTVTGGNAAMVDMSNVTTIDGGKITTNTLNADRILATSTYTMGVGGKLVTSGMGWNTGGPGVFLGWNGAAYGFAVGNWSGNRFYWDGTSLVVVASYVAFGNIVMDGGGITIPNGDASSGSRIRIGGATLYALTTDSLICAGNFSVFGAGYVDEDLYVAGELTCSTLELVGHMDWINPPSTTFSDYPIVWSSGNNDVYYKTNGYNGTLNLGSGDQLVIERGLVISGS
jgi:hypothetical protein